MSKLLNMWADMTGVVLDYALTTPPSADWLLCYGQALPAGTPLTARLRAKLIADGNPFGVDGSGNPRVPDARGRAVAGKDNMGGTAALRLTTGRAEFDGAVLGAAGGWEGHTLSADEMPTHSHGVTDPTHAHAVSDPTHAHSVSDPTHTHAASQMSPAGTCASGTGKNAFNESTGTSGASYTGVSIIAAATGIGIYGAGTGVSIQNAGSGWEHSIVQPTLILNKIIKL